MGSGTALDRAHRRARRRRDRAVRRLRQHKSDSDVIAEPPVDTEVFCLTAARFSSFDQIDIASGGADQLRALAVVATQLGSISPSTIDDDFAAVSAALDNVAAAVDAVPADDPAGIGVVTQKLDDELAAVADQANQAAAYIENWCGPLDSLGSAPPTSVPSLRTDRACPARRAASRRGDRVGRAMLH